MKKIISLAILCMLIATPVLAQKATLISPAGKKVAVEVGQAKPYFGLGYKLQSGLKLGASTSTIPVTPPFGKLVGVNTWTGYNAFSSSTFTGFAQTNFISAYQTYATITPGQLVTVSTTTGGVILASATTGVAGNDFGFLGVAMSTTTGTSTLYVQSAGIVTNLSGLATSTDYYVSNTAGAASSSPNVYPILIGRALSATTLMLGRRTVTGIPITITSGTTYIAPTDGTVTGSSYGAGSPGSCTITVGGATMVSATGPTAGGASCTFSVRKGNTYVATFSGNNSNVGYFTPIN